MYQLLCLALFPRQLDAVGRFGLCHRRDQPRHLVAELGRDALDRHAAILDHVVQQSGDRQILAEAVADEDDRDMRRVCDVGDVGAFAHLIAVRPRRQHQRGVITSRESDHMLLVLQVIGYRLQATGYWVMLSVPCSLSPCRLVTHLPHQRSSVLPSLKPNGSMAPRVKTSRLSRKKNSATHQIAPPSGRSASTSAPAASVTSRLPSGPPSARRMWMRPGSAGSP